MWELRWVLLGLGALVVIGVYLWGLGFLRRSQSFKLRRADRLEPQLAPAPSADDSIPERHERMPESPAAPPPAPERVITLRLVRHDGELDAIAVVTALRDADLEHGRYGIFHRHDSLSGDLLFSIASLTEPGSFDLENLEGATLAGISIFMVLPGTGDPVTRFDAMVVAARSLAVDLNGELLDESGSSWSVQRERYVREEVIEYRHQLERR